RGVSLTRVGRLLGSGLTLGRAAGDSVLGLAHELLEFRQRLLHRLAGLTAPVTRVGNNLGRALAEPLGAQAPEQLIAWLGLCHGATFLFPLEIHVRTSATRCRQRATARWSMLRRAHARPRLSRRALSDALAGSVRPRSRIRS